MKKSCLKLIGRSTALFVLVIFLGCIMTKNSQHNTNEDIDPETCKYKDFKMYGKIEIVESFPDVKVQVVESFPDLKVKVVESFPDDCGEWEFVENFSDLKIQFDDYHWDPQMRALQLIPQPLHLFAAL